MSTAKKPADATLARSLTDAEVDYVLCHLAHHVWAEMPLRDIIHWPRTSSPLRTDFRIGGIPVLFPSDGLETEPYEVTDSDVIVRHDLVKSAFYLLSAYQEWASDERDEWGRFPYEGSIQQRLGIEHTAVVNHYFSWMTDAIVTQCKRLGLKYERLSPLGGPSLHLSHDVDAVRYFQLKRSLYRCAQVVGLRKCDTDRRRLAKAALRSVLNVARLRNDENPYWTFDFIQDVEAYLGYKSDWFFLPDDGGPFPPDYDIEHDADIHTLLSQLVRRGNNVGLHAPINCRTAAEYKTHLDSLNRVCPASMPSARQHFLAIAPTESYRAMAEAGIAADFTFGVSHHEGFRNSYCHPFRPFDHERQEPIGVVCVPLAMMDVSCLVHRAMTFDDIFVAAGEMLDEVRAFGGVFSLLFHNSTLDEVYHPGIHKFFEDLHLLFAQYQLRQFTLPNI